MAAGVGMVDVWFDYRFVVHREDTTIVAVQAPSLLVLKWHTNPPKPRLPSDYYGYLYYLGKDRVHCPRWGDRRLSLHDCKNVPLTIVLASKSALRPAPLALVLQQRTDLNELLQVLQKQFVDESKVAG